MIDQVLIGYSYSRVDLEEAKDLYAFDWEALQAKGLIWSIIIAAQIDSLDAVVCPQLKVVIVDACSTYNRSEVRWMCGRNSKSGGIFACKQLGFD